MTQASGGLLLRNTVWSVVGSTLPLFAALWAIPQIVDHWGAERFGVLTLIWLLIGYFGVFDLGFGRSLTRMVAERLTAREDAQDIPDIVVTALRAATVLGIGAATCLIAASPFIAGTLLRIPPSLAAETAGSLVVLALTLPFVTSTSGLIGVLQAHQRFSTIAAIRIPLGFVGFIGPAVVSMHSTSLVAATTVIAISRVGAWAAYRLSCVGYTLHDGRAGRYRNRWLAELATFGAWVTISNVVGPIIIYSDRFLIGVLLSMTAVAHYATPYEVISRMALLPEAAVAVLFPELARTLRGESAQLGTLLKTAAATLWLTLIVPLGAVVLFAPDMLRVWMGTEFAAAGSTVLRWLAIGIFMNCFARIFLVVIHAANRPSRSALLHVCEAIVFLPVLWYAIVTHGLTGAAVIWAARSFADTVGMYALSRSLHPPIRHTLDRVMAYVIIGASLLAMMMLLDGTVLKLMLLAVLTVLSLYLLKGRISLLVQYRGGIIAQFRPMR